MKKYIYLLILLTFTTLKAVPHENFIASGPMVGYCDYREAMLWVQTKSESQVYFEYWKKGQNDRKWHTETYSTKNRDANTVKLVADSCEFGTAYEYAVYVNGKKMDFPYPLEFKTQDLWQWRHDPPNMKIAVGSCAYINDSLVDRPGKPYGGDYFIYQSIYGQHPDAMLWLGDDVYYREPDYNTRTGMIARQSQVRALPDMQALIASTANYAIWDDHDFGPNDSDRGFFNKEASLDVFKLFWPNPSYGLSDMPGVTTAFSCGDVDFFLMDDRYHRSPDNCRTCERTQLGSKQLQWLFDNLVTSKATFKVVALGGQFLNPLPVYETYATYAEERQKILNFIADEKIGGVIFVTGDRHFSELSKLDRTGTYPLLDFTVSALNSGSDPKSCDEKNPLRVDNFCYNQRNFGIIEVAGKLKERVITFNLFDSSGKLLFSKKFLEKELK